MNKLLTTFLLALVLIISVNTVNEKETAVSDPLIKTYGISADPGTGGGGGGG
jgi:hypothetical protein